MSTLATVEDYIDDVRVLLQDNRAPYRYDDTSLLAAFNETLLEARRIRADLFVYRHGHDHVPSYSTVDSEEVHIEPAFRVAFVYGTVAHALMRDQEDIEDARASAFRAAFNSMLIGTGAAAIVPPPGGGNVPKGGSK